MGEFEGRGVVVTGGASGIGAATVEAFARAGARVAILDRDEAGADAVARATGAHAIAVDVRDGPAVDRAIAAAVDAGERLSVLVNCAGVGDLRPLHSVDGRLWSRILDVNLTGTFHATRAAVGHMAASGGSVVNVASLSAAMPTRGEAAYSAAKAGVVALTRSTALEYGPAIRANCVAPGFVRTPMTAVWDSHPEAFGPLRRAIPLARIGEAAEIAEVILFLASERSAYVTGQTLVVDGGLSLPQAGTDEALARLMDELA
jgi:NAD(P)-dependent dehydrogenase (short-subunit alcohol dehydrogenase family)